MNLPFEYDRVAVGEFGGNTPTTATFAIGPRRHPARYRSIARRPTCQARATVRTRFSSPRRTWSCGTKRPRPTCTASASSRCRRWSFRSASMDEVVARDPARRRRARQARQVPVVLGGEHSITAAGRRGGRRAASPACRCCRSMPTPTCATRSWARRTTTRARCAACSSTRRLTQVGIRSLSPEEAAAAPSLPTEDLLRLQHARRSDDWIDRVVDSLSETVYITIDVRRLRSGDHAGDRHAGTGRAVVVRDAGAAAAGDRSAARRRLRHRGAGADGRQRRAELPVREADLQDPVVRFAGAEVAYECPTFRTDLIATSSSDCRALCGRRW